MNSIFARLMTGDQRVAEAFAKAKLFWDEFYDIHRNAPVDQLANELGPAQNAFYNSVCPGDYAFAKEIMALTALSSLYDERAGFEDNTALARRMIEAFRKSMVSVEVKGGFLDRAAGVYRL